MRTSGKRNRQTYDAMHSEMCAYENEEKLPASSFGVAPDDETTVWRMMLQKVRNFIRERGGQRGGQRRPSKKSDDSHERRLARWVHDQQVNYKNSTNIMRDDMKIREEWEAFLEEHSSIFEANAAAWRSTFEKLAEFVEERRERGERRRRPSRTTEDLEEKHLEGWVTKQQRNYARNVGMMKNMDIRAQWAAFVDAHAPHFHDNKTAWRTTLRNVEQFIEERRGEQRPSFSTGDAYEKRLAHWVWQQRSNYAKKAFIMKDVDIRAEWAAFVEKHDILFGEGSDALRLLLHNFNEAIKEIEEFT
eukprot:6193429-Pleurochrysis_carterae.AAC.2